MKREEVIRLFPERIRKILQQAYWNPQGLQEIRLRAGKPLILWQDGQEYFVAEQGFLTRHREQACIVSQEDIRRTMETVGTYSLYAYEEELKQGFLTIQGGHRVGVAGKAIMEEQKVKLMPPFLHSKQKSKYVRMRRELLDIVEMVEEKEEV